jgi:hypothetical protein
LRASLTKSKPFLFGVGGFLDTPDLAGSSLGSASTCASFGINGGRVVPPLER